MYLCMCHVAMSDVIDLVRKSLATALFRVIANKLGNRKTNIKCFLKFYAHSLALSGN